MNAISRPGPLVGIKVIELASLAPAPFGCMMLADLGAEVITVDRPGNASANAGNNPLWRNRKSITLDLKRGDHVAILLRLTEFADVFVEAFRPGVAERLGCGPEVCSTINSRLIYARMTGWGQEGPLAKTAGHDLNYIAIAGALAAIGPVDRPPTPPLNYVGDFGGGGMLMAFGILAALIEREKSGAGQVIDVAMVDGAALMTAPFHSMVDDGSWSPDRDANLVDGGAPFYRCYETKDGHHLAVGAIEHHFYKDLLAGLDLAGISVADQMKTETWPFTTQIFWDRFRQRTQADWLKVFEKFDACVTPVVTFVEATRHAHNAARGTFVSVGGLLQPAPAPRFSKSQIAPPKPPRRPGEDNREVLQQIGMSSVEIANFLDGF